MLPHIRARADQNQDVETPDAPQPILSFFAMQKIGELTQETQEGCLFVKTLGQVVNQTIRLLAGKVDSILIALADIQNAENLSWTQIELIVCLNTKEYALAETVFFLAENLYGPILENTGFFFTATVLNQMEYQPEPSHLLLTLPDPLINGQTWKKLEISLSRFATRSLNPS